MQMDENKTTIQNSVKTPSIRTIYNTRKTLNETEYMIQV